MLKVLLTGSRDSQLVAELRDRQVLVRYYLRDEDKATLCHDLGLSDEHFNRVLHRARERFRALLGRRYAIAEVGLDGGIDPVIEGRLERFELPTKTVGGDKGRRP